jgi:hypothetical protein
VSKILTKLKGGQCNLPFTIYIVNSRETTSMKTFVMWTRLIKQSNNNWNRENDAIIQIKQQERKEHDKVCLLSSIKTTYSGGESSSSFHYN